MSMFEIALGALRPSFADLAASPDHGILMLACLAMGADGRYDQLEREAVADIARQLPSFAEHSEAELDDAIGETLVELQELGHEAAIAHAGASLAESEDLELAFKAVAFIGLADGRFADAESRLLGALAERFGFEDRKVGELLQALKREMDEES